MIRFRFGTFVLGHLGHCFDGTTGVGEQRFGDSVVSESTSRVPVPLKLRLRHQCSHSSQHAAIFILDKTLLEAVTVKVNAVGRINLPVSSK